MYVCICHGITDREIRQAAEDGCRDVHELTMRSGCGSNCGSCLPIAIEILGQVAAEARAVPLPLKILRAA